MEEIMRLFQNTLNASIEKHGFWDDYTLKQMWDVIEDERQEVLDAELLEDYYGEHGVMTELLQLAVTCVKMANQLNKRRPSGGVS